MTIARFPIQFFGTFTRPDVPPETTVRVRDAYPSARYSTVFIMHIIGLEMYISFVGQYMFIKCLFGSGKMRRSTTVSGEVRE